MKMTYREVVKKAKCVACPSCQDVAGVLVCSEHPNDDSTLPNIDRVNNCRRDKTDIVNGLLLVQSKTGLGFLVEPTNDGTGDGECILAAAGSGILLQKKISELIKDAQLVVIPAYRIYDTEGKDRTIEVLKNLMQKAYENLPTNKVNPFSGLQTKV